VAEFEYMSATGLPLLPIQVAIANASGEHIIPVLSEPIDFVADYGPPSPLLF